MILVERGDLGDKRHVVVLGSAAEQGTVANVDHLALLVPHPAVGVSYLIIVIL